MIWRGIPSTTKWKRDDSKADYLGFPGMLDSIEFFKWVCNNSPTAYHGKYKGKEYVSTVTMKAIVDDRVYIRNSFFVIAGCNNYLTVLDVSPLTSKISYETYPIPCSMKLMACQDLLHTGCAMLSTQSFHASLTLYWIQLLSRAPFCFLSVFVCAINAATVLEVGEGVDAMGICGRRFFGVIVQERFCLQGRRGCIGGTSDHLLVYVNYSAYRPIVLIIVFV